MTIETKFDVGQEVWGILRHPHQGWQWRITDVAHPVKAGIVTIYDRGAYGVAYRIGRLVVEVAEGECFLTKEEAQAECDRRNGGDQHAAATESAPA